MTELVTVPSFNFEQGDVYDGAESYTQVAYYNSSSDSPLIELTQDGNRINFTDVKSLRKLVKEVEKHLSTASMKLKR